MSELAPSCTTCDHVKERYKWSQEEKSGLRNLAKWCSTEWPELYRTFVELTREFSRVGESINYDWNILVKFERELAAICITGNMLQAAVKMAECLVYNADKYLGGSDLPCYNKLVTGLSGYQQRLSQTVL